jgi:hypothetical protein
MASTFYREGMKLKFNGYECQVVHITETYRKNVISVNVLKLPRNFPKYENPIESMRIFEYPDGKLELMNATTKY